MADDQFPLLLTRMVRIVEDVREWIGEYGQCFVESNSVILEVLCRFLGISLEFRGHQTVLSVPVSLVPFCDCGLTARITSGASRLAVRRLVHAMLCRLPRTYYGNGSRR